jgi:PilZ domain
MDILDPAEMQAERARQRDSMFLAGAIWFERGGSLQQVRIRNISPGGMMIDFPQSRVKDSPVFAAIKNVGEVSGRVAWYHDGRMGIVFDNEIDADAARMKPAAAPVEPSFNKPYIESRRPGLAIR